MGILVFLLVKKVLLALKALSVFLLDSVHSLKGEFPYVLNTGDFPVWSSG